MSVITNEFPIVVKPKIIYKSKLKNFTKSFPLRIAQPSNITFQVKPTTSTKNDKLHLLIDSLSDSYKELSQMLDLFKFDENGLHIPRQHKLFFETVITNKEFKNYITVNDYQKDEILQNINFAWYKSPTIKMNINIIPLDKENISGYEFTFKYPSCLSLSVDQRLQEKPLREYLEQSKMLLDDEQIFIQFGIQPCEHEWWKEAEQYQKDLPKRLKVSEISKSKLAYNGFDSCLRLIIQCNNPQRREMIARGIIMAIKQLNGDNELVEKQIKYNKLDKWLSKKVIQRNIDTPLFRFKKRFILTRKEIQHFIKLPQRNLQKDFELDINERDELTIHKLLTGKKGILIGHSEDKGKKVEIRIPVSNLDHLCTTYVINGSPRSGKDTFAINKIVESALNYNIGAFIPDVIDEKGNDRGMCDSIRDSLNSDKVLDLNLGDYNNPIYFGLEDVAHLIGVNGMNVIADNLISVLDLKETTSSQELCSLIAKACKCNIYKMYCCIKSKKYAQEVYEQIKLEDELLAIEYKHEFLEAKRDKEIATVRTRLKMILGNPHFKNMIAQEPNKDIDFEKWIRERKVVLLRMKKMDVGEIGVRILMYLISMKVFWIKKIIQTDDPTFIVFNEPHQYMSDGLQDLMQSMMTEAPKFRLGQLYLFHSPFQLPNKLYEIMKSSSINWFLFKNTNYRFYMDLKEQLYPIEPDTAMKTEKYESIFIPYIDNTQIEPIFVKMLPPPKMRMKLNDNSELTIQHAKLYGRDVNEVREKIKEIELSMYSE